jgi:hypothetical protein
MGEETLKRENESLLKKHGIKAGAGGLLAALVGWLGSGIMDDVKDMTERVAVLETENREIRQREFESIWRTLYLVREKVDENKIDISVVRELMAMGGVGPGSDGVTTSDIMAALEALIAEEEKPFNEYQVDEFRSVQQKAFENAPRGKK